MTKERKKVNKNLFLIVSLLVVYMFSSLLGSSINFASAQETALGGANTFDTTNVLDDLLSANERFTEYYPPNENADPKIQVINFVEYCYSYREDRRSNYGLYVYVYNPTGLNIHTWSNFNQIQLGVAYDSNPVTSESKVTDYEKFDLKFCNASTGMYANLYLKFRVVDKVGKDGKLIAQRVNPAARRYDISGIELVSDDNPNATEYTVANTYTFTGYAVGCSFDENIEESTLECESHHLDTISLDVKHTTYRTKTSSKGAGWQNQIDSVYFTVPETYFEKYGTLQRIKAEWYEFVTKDIVVTSKKEFYDAALNYIGKNPVSFDWRLAPVESTYDYDQWYWGKGRNNPILYYLFLVDKIGNYDPTKTTNETGGILSDDLLEYIRTYDKSFVNGSIELGGKTYSADLFESDIQEDRKINNEIGVIQSGFNGKSYYDFDATVDLISLMSWSGTQHGFWENASNWGFWNALFGSVPKENNIEDITPIYIVTAKDMALKDEDLIKKLYINADDVQAIRNEYSLATLKKEKLVLFRFAKSDYFSASTAVIDCDAHFGLDPFPSERWYRDCAYHAKETVYMNFDIIQLTFLQEGIYTVIPVVSSPIDIVGPITPPTETEQWWEWLLKILKYIVIAIVSLVVVVLLSIFTPVFKFIFSGLGFVLKWLFKGVGYLIVYTFKGIWWLMTSVWSVFAD